jgi:hypothetical protein
MVHLSPQLGVDIETTEAGFNMADAETPKRELTPEARRALDEAEARRKEAKALPKERGGPEGPEPTRYGDWERKGIASDF